LNLWGLAFGISLLLVSWYGLLSLLNYTFTCFLIFSLMINWHLNIILGIYVFSASEVAHLLRLILKHFRVNTQIIEYFLCDIVSEIGLGKIGEWISLIVVSHYFTWGYRFVFFGILVIYAVFSFVIFRPQIATSKLIIAFIKLIFFLLIKYSNRLGPIMNPLLPLRWCKAQSRIPFVLECTRSKTGNFHAIIFVQSLGIYAFT